MDKMDLTQTGFVLDDHETRSSSYHSGKNRCKVLYSSNSNFSTSREAPISHLYAGWNKIGGDSLKLDSNSSLSSLEDYRGLLLFNEDNEPLAYRFGGKESLIEKMLGYYGFDYVTVWSAYPEIFLDCVSNSRKPMNPVLNLDVVGGESRESFLEKYKGYRKQKETLPAASRVSYLTARETQLYPDHPERTFLTLKSTNAVKFRNPGQGLSILVYVDLSSIDGGICSRVYHYAGVDNSDPIRNVYSKIHMNTLLCYLDNLAESILAYRGKNEEDRLFILLEHGKVFRKVHENHTDLLAKIFYECDRLLSTL